MQEKLTIQDIARLAGVSKATVSRVLNHNSSMDSELSGRAMWVVPEHDFILTITANDLARGKTRLVGVLAPPLAWPSRPEILRDVESPHVFYPFQTDHALYIRLPSTLLARAAGGALCPASIAA
ncbi:MAG TPA: LacI family DNA-binding transcriptional regulator [Ktedonobacteraceae bacterium]|nr:LacI family DNA-binding transcriptional regulator [Ktedonobacteraceae bacterium]